MPAKLVAERYELRELLGEGGMGVVYRAVDTRTGGLVAIKTMRDVSDARNLEMFKKEWRVLARLSHPNIVDIRDVDEVEEDGVRKPCFVMPLLPGVTLADLIKQSSSRLTVTRVVSIISQVCSGLEAAHRCELIHRDLKPSNIFVMEDDNAKIIDFGLVHAADAKSVTGYKGTWQYMAPEQTEGRSPTVQSDIYSLGVVAYEALTARKPFARKTVEATIDSVRTYIPPAISEINSKVSQLVSKVIHKAMAKQPTHRYSSAKEFAETLQKACRNEPIERFDPAKILPRIERARKAFTRDDSAFASEILTELEAEGNVDPEITLLRAQIEESVKQRRIRQLFESAQTRLEQDEIPLALDKLREILALDPDNGEARLMRKRIEDQRNTQQIVEWMKLARQHVQLHDFQEARQALKEVLNIRYDDPEALGLLSDIDIQENEAKKARADKEQLYGSALKAYQGGEISNALSKLEKILEVSRRAPGATVPEREAVYQSFYNRVRSERDAIDKAYEDGRRFLNDKEFQKAIEVCDIMLATYPASAQFQALKLRIEQSERQELSAYIAEVGRSVDSEPDLDRRLHILEEASKRYPNEGQFQQLLRMAREQRDLVQSILAKARQYEEQGQLGDAIAQWKILRNIHPQYPGGEFEIAQLEKRHEQQTADEAKTRFIEQIDRAMESGSFSKAVRQVEEALVHFPQDSELAVLERIARQGLERVHQAEQKFEEAKKARGQGRFEEALDLLRGALSLDERNQGIRSALVSLLVERSQVLVNENWRDSERMAQAASELDDQHPAVKRLKSLIAEAKRRDVVTKCVADARNLQLTGDVPAAITRLNDGLSHYPGEPKLLQFQANLQNSLQWSSKGSKPAEANEEAPLAPARMQEDEHAVEVASHPESVLGGAGSEFFPNSIANSRFEPLTSFVAPGAAAAKPEAPRESAPLTGPQPSTPAPAGQPRAETDSQAQPRPALLSKFAGLPAARLLEPKILGISLSAVALLCAALWGFAHRDTPRPVRKTQPAVQNAIPVPVTLAPADAHMTIDGVEMTAGTLSVNGGKAHDVRVSRLGYKSFEQTGFRAERAGWKIVLQPEPLHVQVSTGERSARVMLDGQEIGNFQQSEVVNYDFMPDGGRHILSAKNQSGELFRVDFQAQPGRFPNVSPITTPDLIVASALGDEAVVFSGNAAGSLTLPGGKAEAINKTGTAIGLSGGDAEQFAITVADARHHQSFAFAHGNAPALSIALNANANLASITITTAAEGAQLLVDGRERKTRKPGSWRLFGLQPGAHEVRLIASGYADEVQTIQLEKGQNLVQAIEMKPASATLVISNGIAGARISIDGNPAGSLDGSGGLRVSISPGAHEIQAQKEDYEGITIHKSFSSGQALALQGGDLSMKPFAVMTFEVTPAVATVEYRRVDESEWHPGPVSGAIRIKSGNYEVKAAADSYKTESQTIFLASGERGKVRLDLPKSIIETVRTITTRDLFQHPGDVSQADTRWYTGGTSSYLALRHKDVFSLVFLKPEKLPIKHKGKKIEWRVFIYPDAEIDYELDGQQLTRRVKSNGKTNKTSIKLDAANGDAFYSVKVMLEAHHIVVKSKNGASLDDFLDDEHDWSQGTVSIRGDQYFVVSDH